MYKTMLEMYEAQANELGDYEALIYRAFLNSFVMLCDEEGIERFEAIFNIQADPSTESLDFRKNRIILKFTTLPPYTKIFAKQMLDNIFGAENVDFEIIYNNYKVMIGIESNLQNVIDATFEDLRQLIPANMTLEQFIYEEYMHRYLRRHYTYEEMKQFTYGELSQYA